MAAKYKVVRKAPFISKKEVEQTKDFDKVLSRLQGEQPVSTGFALKHKIFVGILLLIGGLVFTWYQSNLKLDSQENTSVSTQEETIKTLKNENEGQEISLEKLENTTNKVDSEIDKINKPKEDEQYKFESIAEKDQDQPKQPKITQPKDQPDENTLNTELATAKASEKIESITNYTTDALAYSEAAPIIGFDSLYSYFAKALNYPDSLKQYDIEGQVTVGFSINEAGEPINIRIEESLHEALDKEAIRIVAEMPLWIPAKAYGEPLTSNMSIPITFQLK